MLIYYNSYFFFFTLERSHSIVIICIYLLMTISMITVIKIPKTLYLPLSLTHSYNTSLCGDFLLNLFLEIRVWFPLTCRPSGTEMSRPTQHCSVYPSSGFVIVSDIWYCSFVYFVCFSSVVVFSVNFTCTWLEASVS